MTPQKERKGRGEGEEVSPSDVDVINTLSSGVLLAPPDDSPEPESKAPTKQVVFRSTNRRQVLYQKAGYIDKSHGLASYIPSTGVAFDDYYLRIDDTKENAKKIEWVRNHPSIGVAFIEVPDLSNMIELPTIKELEEMTIGELGDLCVKHEVKVKPDASKDSLVLSLLKGVQK